MSGGRREPIGVRIYRALTRLLPQSHREDYGADAAELFEELYEEARRRGAAGRP